MLRGTLNSSRWLPWLIRYSAGAAIAWLILITALCSMPGQYIPSNNWLEMLSVDKLVHAAIFGILTVLLLVVAIKRRGGKIAFVSCFLFASAYGILMELMQAYVFSNRSADWQDAVANTLGAVIALFFIRKLKQTIESFKP